MRVKRWIGGQQKIGKIWPSLHFRKDMMTDRRQKERTRGREQRKSIHQALKCSENAVKSRLRMQPWTVLEIRWWVQNYWTTKEPINKEEDELNTKLSLLKSKSIGIFQEKTLNSWKSFRLWNGFPNTCNGGSTLHIHDYWTLPRQNQKQKNKNLPSTQRSWLLQSSWTNFIISSHK